MTGSAARIAANRLNAQKSTGPRTVAGKAVARLNAFQHGLAGEGDLLGPGEDAAQVARRTVAFIQELGAVGEAGCLLARRAAILSVRMERAAEREAVAGAVGAEEAKLEFDQLRLDAVAEQVAAIEAGEGGIEAAMAALETAPEGVIELLAAWDRVGHAIAAPDRATAERGVRLAALWLGLTPAQAAELPRAGWGPLITAEVQRLAQVGRALRPTIERIAQVREQVGLLARFDPTPEAVLARRYEAAAERGMYRAFRTIAAINQARARARRGTRGPSAPRSPRSPPPTPRPRLRLRLRLRIRLRLRLRFAPTRRRRSRRWVRSARGRTLASRSGRAPPPARPTPTDPPPGRPNSPRKADGTPGNAEPSRAGRRPGGTRASVLDRAGLMGIDRTAICCNEANHAQPVFHLLGL